MKKPSPEDELRLLEERMAATLYLAGEAVADVPIPDPANHAEPVSTHDAPLMTDFDWLKELIATFRETLAADPRRLELLRLLPKTLADGENLRILFCNLFPEQRGQRKMFRDSNGKTRLSPVQREVLRDAAAGMSYKEIAAKRQCSYVNVSSTMQNTFRRLNASSLQEAVATAIAMGYLPLDVMDFVNAASHCSTRDYSDMNCLVSYITQFPKTEAPERYQDLAAFGLLLMLVSGTTIYPEHFAANPRPQNGILCRLLREKDSGWRAERILGPEVLRYPQRIAIAPPEANREGFTPGNIFVTHSRRAMDGLNTNEILEVTPEGEVVRSFCGASTMRTRIHHGYGMTFTASGALLLATDAALLRFTQNGERVETFCDGCCVDVVTDRKGQIIVTHSSGRGDTIAAYSSRGKILQEIGPTTAGIHNLAVRVTSDGHLFMLQLGNEAMMQVYNTEGEQLRCWPLAEPGCVFFALDEQAERLYVPCYDAHALQIYALDGTPGPRILLDETIYPRGVTQSHDGTLYFIGFIRTP